MQLEAQNTDPFQPLHSWNSPTNTEVRCVVKQTCTAQNILGKSRTAFWDNHEVINIILVLEFCCSSCEFWWSGQCLCPPSAHGTHDISEKSEPQNKTEQTAAAQATKARGSLWVLRGPAVGSWVQQHSLAQSGSGVSGMPGKPEEKQQLNRLNSTWAPLYKHSMGINETIKSRNDHWINVPSKGSEEISFCLYQKKTCENGGGKGTSQVVWMLDQIFKLFSNYLHSQEPVTSNLSSLWKKIT